MAKVPKYATEEERLEARRESQRRYHNKRTFGKDDGGYQKLMKNYRIDNKDGINIKIETPNRLNINLVIIEYFVTFMWFSDQSIFNELRQNVYNTINQWLNRQSDWNKKKKLFIWENPDKYHNPYYTKKHTSLSFQLYLKKDTPPLTWKQTVEAIIPLTDEITEALKNTSQKADVLITNRMAYNEAWQIEHYGKLTDASASESS